jgi:hypothetical protein
MREGPPFRDQPPVPSKQCRGRDQERPPAFPRYAPTRGCEEEPVDRRQHGPLALSAENGKFVAEDDDFQLFEVVRPHPQGSELEKATQHQVAE